MSARKMKESGIEWIGEIPENWIVKKLRYLGEFSSNGVDKKIVEGEDTYKSVHYMDVYRNSMQEIGNNDNYLVVSATKLKAANCDLKKGDAIFTNSSETPEDIGHSTVVKEDLDNTLMGYHLMRFRPSEDLAYKYEKYLFGSMYVRGSLANQAYGITRYGISYIDFADILIPYPNVEEQKAIAAYLDEKCAAIDQIVASKQKQNGQLAEYRQSLITEAVTKGLNPAAPMKDSGIEWIGEIPEHWDICRLKYYAKINNGRDYKEIVDENGNYPVIGSGGQFANAKQYLYNRPSVLLGRKGTIDKPMFVDYPFWTVDTMFYTEINEGHDSKFFYYLCLTIRFDYYQYGSAVPSMTQKDLSESIFTLPPLSEQKSIAAYLDKKCGEIDALSEHNKNIIESLQEYKQSLIYEAVTGKIEL